MEEHAQALEAFRATPDPERYLLVMARSLEELGEYDQAFDYFSRLVERGEPLVVVDAAREHLAKEFYADLPRTP